MLDEAADFIVCKVEKTQGDRSDRHGHRLAEMTCALRSDGDLDVFVIELELDGVLALVIGDSF